MEMFMKNIQNDKSIKMYYKKEECCGCSACFVICPKNAISMEYDNEGFQYPVIDVEKCINCKLCKKVCIISNDN